MHAIQGPTKPTLLIGALAQHVLRWREASDHVSLVEGPYGSRNRLVRAYLGISLTDLSHDFFEAFDRLFTSAYLMVGLTGYDVQINLVPVPIRFHRVAPKGA